jgi:hypothetical protein
MSIVKSSEPFISNDIFILYSDVVLIEILEPHVINSLFYNVKTLPIIIFVKTELFDFYLPILEKIQVPFVVITTCNNDYCMPYYYFPCNDHNIQKLHDKFLKNPFLIVWFTKNPSIIHPKLSSIPLGPKWQYESHNFFGEDKTPVIDILNKYCLNPFDNFVRTKDKLLYFNFGQTTDNPIFEPHKNIREYVLEICQKNGFSISPGGSFETYLGELSQYKFCLSPPGRGIDTHRTWESLMVGTIPIVQNTTLDYLYDNLPVLIINHWSIITPEFLEKKYEEIMSKKDTYDFSRLYTTFWINKIRMNIT